MKKLMLVVVMAFASAFAFAQDAEIVKVRGKGSGADRAEALKDAYRDAVERAVGLYVDAEQMMKNEELVKDQILTQSNAYIEKCEVAKETTKPNGFVEIQILAEVRKVALTKKISDVMPGQTVNVAAESRNAHAVAVTEAKMLDDALALIKNELKGYDPVRQLMTVTLASPRPEIEHIKGDSENIRLWYAVDVKVDESKYYGEFVPRWARLLEQIKSEPAKAVNLKEEREVAKCLEANRDRLQKHVNKFGGRSDVRSFTGVVLPAKYRLPFVPGPSPLRYCGSALNEQFVDMTFLRGRLFDKEAIVGGLKDLMDVRETGPMPTSSVWSDGALWNGGYMRLRECFDRYGDKKYMGDGCMKSIVFLEKRSGACLYGRSFIIPQDCMEEILGWQQDYVTVDQDVEKGGAKHVDYQMSLLDEGGAPMAFAPFELLTGYLCNSGWIVQNERGGGSRKRGGVKVQSQMQMAWFVTPFVGACAGSFRKWIPVELPKDDVAKVTRVRVELANQ